MIHVSIDRSYSGGWPLIIYPVNKVGAIIMVAKNCNQTLNDSGNKMPGEGNLKQLPWPGHWLEQIARALALDKLSFYK